MWKQAGLNSKATIFSVAATGSLVVRVIEVPKMTDGELADNMRVDADRYIPFPPSEVVMDYKALRDLPSGSRCRQHGSFAGGGAARNHRPARFGHPKSQAAARAPSTSNLWLWRAPCSWICARKIRSSTMTM